MEAILTSKVAYGKKSCDWGSIVVQKTLELAKFLNGDRKTSDSFDPFPTLTRDDSLMLREKILNLPSAK